MRDFDLGRTFDVVVCLFSSIGYVKTIEAMLQTIQTFARHTAPGGVVIVEPWFAPGVLTPGHTSAITAKTTDFTVARV